MITMNVNKQYKHVSGPDSDTLYTSHIINSYGDTFNSCTTTKSFYVNMNTHFTTTKQLRG